MKSKKKAFTKRKLVVITVIIAVILIVGRLLLPFYVKEYVNEVLADIPGYHGQVEGINICLLRGAYEIEYLSLQKIQADSKVPFLDFKRTNISIEWTALFKGKIVSEIVMTEPKLNYVFEDQGTGDSESPVLNDWTKALTDLVPIDINRLEIINGKASFIQLSTSPTIDLYFDQISLEAKNLKNVARENLELPSTIRANAVSIGQGNVQLEGKLDLIKTIPDMDISFSLEKTNMKSLNDFTHHYTGLDFEEGDLSIYSEVVIVDSYLKGYIKPILTNAKLIGNDDGFLDTLWEGFVGFFKFLLKNHKKDSLATKVPLQGNLNNVKTSSWNAILNIFKNAWIKAFENVTDDSINFENVQKEMDKK
ncbi:protein of unknown function [Aquimarina spongiae]|uniref:DUF748 domain-containing protein n=2 Tax=Aquimarina spongiae TaxID=570521 RepID=A0A1M6GM29_9FLAO|nr:protein of unknown function [Aquimarina spongiae]